jgi:hypothetical protein
VLTCLSHQRLSAVGTIIGSFDLLPPTSTLQEHVTGLGVFKLHVGIGLDDEFSKNDYLNLGLSANMTSTEAEFGEFKSFRSVSTSATDSEP